MNRGPQASKVNIELSNVEKLNARTHGQPEDWLLELAVLCDRIGQKRAAQKINYAPSTVSQVLKGNYLGDLERVEQSVRGALMGLTVECPVLGTIGRDRCLVEQRRNLSAANSELIQVYYACRNGTCPHSRVGGTGNG